jgi:iron complex outermembrane receptor protein
MGNTLDATSAKTEISSAVITNFMAPVADFAEVIQQAPGAFSLNPNGIGLGQGKSFFRGFSDGQYTMTFDGIPFEDTNSPTHHSWASFPSQWISSTDFDRSPGQAFRLRPDQLRRLHQPEVAGTAGRPRYSRHVHLRLFNTKLYSLDAESGLFGPGKKGFRPVQHQRDDLGRVSDLQPSAARRRLRQVSAPLLRRTSLSLYGGVVDIWNNTPNTTNPTRAQVAQYGDNYLLDSTPTCTAVR